MSAIDDKYQELQGAGLDLGPAISPEQDAGFGGRVGTYQHGNIYEHPNTGAHEVHGGILSLYLAHGGPGINPQTGVRELGFPTSDETASVWGPPGSWFETGVIYWIPGTRGCVMFGSAWSLFDGHNELGMPLTGSTPLAGGTVIYCERGAVFSAPAPVPPDKRWLIATIEPPRMGHPMILDPADEAARHGTFRAIWPTFDHATYDAVTAWRPTIFADIWAGRLALSPVGSPFSLIPLDVEINIVDQTVGQIDPSSTVRRPFWSLLVTEFCVVSGGLGRSLGWRSAFS